MLFSNQMIHLVLLGAESLLQEGKACRFLVAIFHSVIAINSEIPAWNPPCCGKLHEITCVFKLFYKNYIVL